MTDFRWDDDMARRIGDAAMRGVMGWASLIEQRTVDLILSPPKTGRIYRRRGIAHQASAPGEAPASDTGNLVRNREIQLIPERYAARIRLMAAYAIHLERGTIKMEPRPSISRALNETEEQGMGMILEGIAAELRA